jgi:protein TonB
MFADHKLGSKERLCAWATRLMKTAYSIYICSFLLSVSLVLCIVALLIFILQPSSSVHESLVVREINTPYIPPPPPKMMTKSLQTSDIQLNVTGADAIVKPLLLQTMPIVSFDITDAPILPSPELIIKMPEINWLGYGLNELDQVPRLLSDAKINVPPDLKRQNLRPITVKLEVSIDISGSVSLIRIKLNPYPELRFEIEQMVKRARFTAPQKAGEKVKARFIWPLEVQL